MSPENLIGERPVFSTELGALFRGDCTELLPRFPDACVNTVFADPPFNLGKEYGVERQRPPGRGRVPRLVPPMAGRMLPDPQAGRGDLRLQHPALEYRAGASPE